MTTEILEQSGLVIEETPAEALNLYPLETFGYKYPGKEIRISFECPEFTAICPFSDFPDFATIKLDYAPNQSCVELKSLKLYITRSVRLRCFTSTSSTAFSKTSWSLAIRWRST